MNYRKLSLSVVGLLAIVFGVVTIFSAPHAAAATPPINPADVLKATFVWQDRAHIQATIGSNTFTFYDSNIGDGNQQYSVQGYGCTGQLTFGSFLGSKQNGFVDQPTSASLKFDVIKAGTATTNCRSVSGANSTGGSDLFSIGNITAANTLFKWSGGNLVRVDDSSAWTYSKASPASTNAQGEIIYLKNSEKGASCQDRLVVSTDNKSASVWTIDPSDGNSFFGGSKQRTKLTPDLTTRLLLSGSTCYYDGQDVDGTGIASNTGQLAIANLAEAPGATPGSGSTTVANSCSTGTDANGNCSASTTDNTVDCGSGALNWIACPVIKLSLAAADKVDGFIMGQLNIDIAPIFDQTTVTNSASYGYYKAWNSFRVLATALLVIGGLVMVASQALGFEFLDAYTIRKTLPRILVAIIGISLSWPLMRLAVDFFDTAGIDIRQLMYGPFKNFGGTISVGTGILSTLGVGAALFIIGPASLTFILTALLAVFVGFIILIIRQIALIALIVLAPIAIACYILPNTQKVWKLWIDNFLGLLLMFPIISALIAAGHIFAAVSIGKNAGGQTGSVVAQAIGIVAYFAPYFLLPLAARLATGAIGSLAGTVNDRGKGAFDRLKGIRGNAAQKNLTKMKSGSRFSDRNKLTRGINRTTAGAGAGWQGRFGVGERGTHAIGQARANSALNDVMKSPKWNAIQHNDDVLMAATYDSAGAARTALRARYRNDLNSKVASGELSAAEADAKANKRADSAVTGTQTSIGFGRPQAIAAAQQLAATGTGYSNIQDAAQTIARASGGDAGLASSLAGNINSETKRAGRFDLAPGFGKLDKLAQNEIKGGSNAPNVEDYHSASVAAVRGADAVSMLRGKPQQVEYLTNTLAAHARDQATKSQNLNLSAAQKAAAKDEFIQTMGQIDQLNQSKSYASHDNQEHVNKLLNDTQDLRGVMGGLTGNPSPNPGPVSPAQANQDRYNQVRAPRGNNDPNNPNAPGT